MINKNGIPRLFLSLSVLMMLSIFTGNWDSPADAQERNASPNQKKVGKETIERRPPPEPPQGCSAALFPIDPRTIDGTQNNCIDPAWGSAPIALLRLTRIGYGDGQQTPSGETRPNVREISNIVVHQGDRDISYGRDPKYSDFLWQWGQFLDHDLDLTPIVDPAEPLDIEVPRGDKYFDPDGTGDQTISFERSLYTTVNGVRQQVNHITAFIDASNVYGSDSQRARALRTLDGTGRLKMSQGRLLPFNEEGLPNATPGGVDPASFFLAGDFRANEQVGLTAMHTLFVREHNYWVDFFRNRDSTLTGDELYERARAIVGAEMQHITYHEFLPLLLGGRALSRYRGYQPDVNPGISNVFATAAYRFGHSLVSPNLRRLDKRGKSIGDLPSRQAFFNPTELTIHGIEPLLRGLASQSAQRFDVYIVDDLRNFLFGEPGGGGFDLASLNMQRGRDHGLSSYNKIREDLGLRPVTRFDQINSDPRVHRLLRAAYGSVEDLDIWIAGLAEEPVSGAVVGETVLAILKDQFERLRDGDRFWYEIYLPPRLVDVVKAQTLADIIRRNTTIGREIQHNVFLVR